MGANQDIITEAIYEYVGGITDDNNLDISIAEKEIYKLVPAELRNELDYVLRHLVLKNVFVREYLLPDIDGVLWADQYYILTETGRKEVLQFHNVNDADNKNDLSNLFTVKLKNTIEAIRNSQLSEIKRKDYAETLDEIMKCYSNGCNNATIALSGKMVEIYLNEILGHFSIKIEHFYYDKRMGKSVPTNDLTLGQLFQLTDEIPKDEKSFYIKKQAIDLIKSYRNGTAHFSEKIPVPSQGEAESILSLIIDIIERRLSYNW